MWPPKLRFNHLSPQFTSKHHIILHPLVATCSLQLMALKMHKLMNLVMTFICRLSQNPNQNIQVDNQIYLIMYFLSTTCNVHKLQHMIKNSKPPPPMNVLLLQTSKLHHLPLQGEMVSKPCPLSLVPNGL